MDDAEPFCLYWNPSADTGSAFALRDHMSIDVQQKLPTGPFARFDDRECAAIERAIAERRAVRGFKDHPVPRELIERIIDIAARAPSGTNMQPWRAYVLAGEAKRALSDAIAREWSARPRRREGKYRYYPKKFFEPYLSRRRKIGWDLYGLLGIKKGDDAAMHSQHGKNFDFFGAPIGAIFTIDRRLEIGSWLDYGMFLENIMIAARAHEDVSAGGFRQLPRCRARQSRHR